MPLNEKRVELITASIPFVIEKGWSENAFEAASQSIGQEVHYWKLFFPNILAAVDFFEAMEDENMLHRLVSYEKLDGIRNKIGKALFERILNISGGYNMILRLEEFYTGNIGAMRQNLPSKARIIWRSCDIIWHFAGDTSTDFNHYTKRTLLSGVYIAVIKESLKTEKNIEYMEQYIAQTLNKVVKYGSMLGKIKNLSLEDIPILRMFC